jgi:hypothetical protein
MLLGRVQLQTIEELMHMKEIGMQGMNQPTMQVLRMVLLQGAWGYDIGLHVGAMATVLAVLMVGVM